MTSVDSPWLTVAEARTYTGKGRRSILEALADETLRGHRSGERGRWHIHVNDLDAWMRGERADVQIQRVTRRAS
jgi:excisionase family DNA binding protein